MVHEIQKTFLLPDATLLEKLQKDGIVFEIYEIETFYTKITYFYDVKFQNLNGNFYKITRLNNPILEQNQEEKISKKDYEKARKKLIEKSIKKKRYEFKLCSFKSLIDVYEDLNKRSFIIVFYIQIFFQKSLGFFIKMSFFFFNAIKNFTRNSFANAFKLI